MTLNSISLNFQRISLEYCWQQRCKHVEFEQFWHAFASRGFVSDSWAFLLKKPYDTTGFRFDYGPTIHQLHRQAKRHFDAVRPWQLLHPVLTVAWQSSVMYSRHTYKKLKNITRSNQLDFEDLDNHNFAQRLGNHLGAIVHPMQHPIRDSLSV